MTAPIFKKATDTAAGDATKYGAPDIKYIEQVLDGTHPGGYKLQIEVIEGIEHFAVCSFYVRQQVGSGLYVATRPDTGQNYTDTDFGTLMNTIIALLPVPSSTNPIGVILISGATLDCGTTSITVNKPCIIDGMGSAVVRKTTDYTGTNRSVFNIASSNVTLKDLIIDITIQTGQQSKGIVCQPSAATYQNISIRRVRIKNCYQGIYLHASSGTTYMIDHAVVEDCWIDNTSTTQTGEGIIVGLGCRDITVEYCTLIEPGNTGIDIFATQPHIKIWGNNIVKNVNTTGSAIQVSDLGGTSAVFGAPTQDVSIRENDISGAMLGSCIRIWGGAESVKIENNFMKGGARDGIEIIAKTVSSADYFAKEVTAVGNLIQSMTRNGIYVSYTGSTIEFQGLQISNNDIKNVGANAINLNSSVKNASVEGNRIYRYGTDVAADRTGILLRNTLNTTVRGNKIFGLTATSTPVAGTNYTSVREEATTNLNTISLNGVNNPISTLGANTIVSFNEGFKTEASNIVTATPTGTPAQITVTHGLGYTPTVGEIHAGFTTPWGATTSYWVSNPTSTTFIINLSPQPGQSVTLAWQIGKGY